MPDRKLLTQIRYSLLTGKAVWVCINKTKVNAYQRYHRAVVGELKRKEQWAEIVEMRTRNILCFLNDLLSRIPINVELTPKQKAAAKELQRIANDKPEFYNEFYDHIILEKWRRRKSGKITT